MRESMCINIYHTFTFCLSKAFNYVFKHVNIKEYNGQITFN